MKKQEQVTFEFPGSFSFFLSVYFFSIIKKLNVSTSNRNHSKHNTVNQNIKRYELKNTNKNENSSNALICFGKSHSHVNTKFSDSTFNEANQNMKITNTSNASIVFIEKLTSEFPCSFSSHLSIILVVTSGTWPKPQPKWCF